MGRRRWWTLALAVALAAILAPADPVSAVPVAKGTYANPIVAMDFPDPFVLRDAGTYYAYATNANGPNIQTFTSTDLRTWVLHRDALPSLPAWAVPGRTWAPSVVKTANQYVLYYTARHRTGNLPCIGRAVGRSPVGPFLHPVAEPLVCQPTRGGSIDPSPFVDAFGRPWLLWKSEGIWGREPTRIWSRPLSLDGVRFEGTATQLVERDLAWEGEIIENPSMVRARGAHFLFYSGGRWQDSSYGIGFAVCDGPAGPCRKAPHKWIGSTGDVAGPGGQEFFRGPDGSLWMSYHAWDASRIGYPNGGRRSLRVDRIWFGHRDGNPRLLGPTTGPVQY